MFSRSDIVTHYSGNSTKYTCPKFIKKYDNFKLAEI